MIRSTAFRRHLLPPFQRPAARRQLPGLTRASELDADVTFADFRSGLDDPLVRGLDRLGEIPHLSQPPAREHRKPVPANRHRDGAPPDRRSKALVR